MSEGMLDLTLEALRFVWGAIGVGVVLAVVALVITHQENKKKGLHTEEEEDERKEEIW